MGPLGQFSQQTFLKIKAQSERQDRIGPTLQPLSPTFSRVRFTKKRWCIFRPHPPWRSECTMYIEYLPEASRGCTTVYYWLYYIIIHVYGRYLDAFSALCYSGYPIDIYCIVDNTYALRRFRMHDGV